MNRVIFILCLCLFCTCAFSQYKPRHFKEGYIIKNNDTITCKVLPEEFTNPYEEVVYRYTNNKFEESVASGPGSDIKGFGYKKDSVLIEYTVFSKKKSTLFKNKHENVFGLIVEKGRITLIEHNEERYHSSTMNPGGGFGMGSSSIKLRYYLIVPGRDTAVQVFSSGLLSSGTDEAILKEVIADYPELVSR